MRPGLLYSDGITWQLFGPVRHIQDVPWRDIRFHGEQMSAKGPVDRLELPALLSCLLESNDSYAQCVDMVNIWVVFRRLPLYHNEPAVSEWWLSKVRHMQD
jgi:hypothetical protein